MDDRPEDRRDSRVWPPEPAPGEGEPLPGRHRSTRRLYTNPYARPDVDRRPGGGADADAGADDLDDADAPDEPDDPDDPDWPDWPPRSAPAIPRPGRARLGEAADPSWPARRYGEPDEDLPPSAKWYGTPSAPARRRPPRGVQRILGWVLAAAAGVAALIAVVALVLRLVTPAPTVSRVADAAAGVGYPLPAGWSQGAVPPVTGFTSVASAGRTAAVMTRPEPGVAAGRVRARTIELADLYSRLLLHGDKITVVDDRAVTLAGRSGYSRALSATYTDVVNRPAYLRVVVLADRGGRSVVLVALAQPDTPAVRAAVESVVAGLG